MAVVEAVAALLNRMPAKDVSAISVAVPGLAYPGGVVWAPNIPGWEQMPLGNILHRYFKLPILVESDRNAFVTGEAWQGCARGCTDAVFITIGTGIGAGIISGGRLLRGSNELSGCLGWMAARDRFLPTYKSVGCLEAHVAGPGIARAARRVFQRDMESREVVRLARGGDVRAQKVFSEAGHFLGLALANLVDILNPQVIVIGGGVAAAGRLLLGPAEATMQRWAQPLAVQHVQVIRSRLGGQAGLLGAAKLCLDGLQGRGKHAHG
jgi:glucokinase